MEFAWVINKVKTNLLPANKKEGRKQEISSTSTAQESNSLISTFSQQQQSLHTFALPDYLFIYSPATNNCNSSGTGPMDWKGKMLAGWCEENAVSTSVCRPGSNKLVRAMRTCPTLRTLHWPLYVSPFPPWFMSTRTRFIMCWPGSFISAESWTKLNWVSTTRITQFWKFHAIIIVLMHICVYFYDNFIWMKLHNSKIYNSITGWKFLVLSW